MAFNWALLLRISSSTIAAGPINRNMKKLGHANIGIISCCIEISQWCIHNTWLFDTQSRGLQADWLISITNEKAALDINMPYLFGILFTDSSSAGQVTPQIMRRRGEYHQDNVSNSNHHQGLSNNKRYVTVLGHYLDNLNSNQYS